MKKGNKWIGYLMGIIAIIAVATALIVFILTKIQDHQEEVEIKTTIELSE